MKNLGQYKQKKIMNNPELSFKLDSEYIRRSYYLNLQKRESESPRISPLKCYQTITNIHRRTESAKVIDASEAESPARKSLYIPLNEGSKLMSNTTSSSNLSRISGRWTDRSRRVDPHLQQKRELQNKVNQAFLKLSQLHDALQVRKKEKERVLSLSQEKRILAKKFTH